MEYYILIAGIVIFVIAVFIKGKVEEGKRKRQFEESLRKNYGKEPVKNWKDSYYFNIEKYHEKHKTSFEIDDITWNDLSMDRVFTRIDYTFSRIGTEYLYHVLRTPCFQEEEQEKRQKKIEHFMNSEEERIKLQLAFSKMGAMENFSLYDYIDNLDTLGEKNNIKHYIADLLFIPGILLLMLSPGYGIMAVIGLVVYNLMTYFKEKAEIDPYITSFSYIMKLLATVAHMEKLNPSFLEEEIKELVSSKAKFRKFSRGSYILMSANRMTGDPFEILLDYVRMIFHLDIMKFNSMLSEVRKHTKDVDYMITLLGEMELIVSIGAYRASLKEWCVPEFLETTELNMEEGYHLLLNNPVKNSIQAEKGTLLTGSNASGKSTFLKTVALNVLLGQTLYTCTAKRFRMTRGRLYSSMALRDDLEAGESYYIVEIKALKRILEAVREEGKPPVICFVDEVLRGTNTVERIAASTELLKSLSGKGVLTFAATHDIELTHLLEIEYRNYHFEEEIKGNDVFFSYLLQQGRAVTRNAIKLLEVMGYEDAIIERAQNRAEHFLEKGNWE